MVGPPRDAGREAERLRAFFALELGDAARAAAGALARALREGPRGESVRWVREEKLHVTLCFLGDIAADRVDDLLREVATRTPAVAPFDLELGRVHAFPSPRRFRVVALEVGPLEPLQRLAAAVTEGVVAAGLPVEERPFRGHLTLGRVRPRERAPDVTGPDTPDAEATGVTEVVLFRSELEPRGSRYTPLGRAPLGAQPGAQPGSQR